MDVPHSTIEDDFQADDAFLSIQTRRDVARILGISEKQLVYCLYTRPRASFYNLFEIRKKNGGSRQITAPIGAIKYMQFRLSKLLAQVYKPKAAAHGFIKNKSILTNAAIHLRQKCLLNIDLKDFFPTINFGRVRGLFKSQPFNFSSEVATILAQICCYNGALPQGAPTSPVISNMICNRLDKQLHKLARTSQCRYTRYADDITFSTFKSRLPAKIAYLSDTHQVIIGKDLVQIVESNGFAINDAKTRMRSRYQSQQVTGLVVNEKLNVRREFVRKVRAMLYAWEKFGLEAAEIDFFKHDHKSTLNRDNARFSEIVRGKIEYLGYIKGKNDPVYQLYLRKLRQLCPSMVDDEKLITRFEQMENSVPLIPIIWTEGKTDIKHLKSALRWLKARGRFLNLDLEYGGDSTVTDSNFGDNNLLMRCKQLADHLQKQVTIAVFDRDKQNTVLQVHDESIGYKIWDNNVYSFAIPIPEHRKRDGSKDICIEHYYQDEEIKSLDVNGRRLYLYDEFNSRSLRHKEDMRLSIPQKQNAKPKAILDNDVYNDKGENVALSKDAFANYIYEQSDGFNDFSFDEFARIFEVIEKILRRHS